MFVQHFELWGRCFTNFHYRSNHRDHPIYVSLLCLQACASVINYKSSPKAPCKSPELVGSSPFSFGVVALRNVCFAVHVVRQRKRSSLVYTVYLGASFMSLYI